MRGSEDGERHDGDEKGGGEQQEAGDVAADGLPLRYGGVDEQHGDDDGHHAEGDVGVEAGGHRDAGERERTLAAGVDAADEEVDRCHLQHGLDGGLPGDAAEDDGPARDREERGSDERGRDRHEATGEGIEDRDGGEAGDGGDDADGEQRVAEQLERDGKQVEVERRTAEDGVEPEADVVVIDKRDGIGGVDALVVPEAGGKVSRRQSRKKAASSRTATTSAISQRQGMSSERAAPEGRGDALASTPRRSRSLALTVASARRATAKRNPAAV